MIGKTNKKTVFVGLSGGVDSSVSAALLKEQGYNVVGVFIKVWSPDFLPCTWREERRDAMRVAAKLDIPFLTFDFEDEYKKDVVDYMLREYKAGRTPNPDVMCNKYVKFGAFLNKALELGADFVATGHYARILSQKNTRDEKNEALFHLATGKDKEKDQSYFLWTLTQEQMKYVLFPIGHLEKKDVRKLASKFGLLTAEKKDSQGLCFIGKLDMKDFLGKFIEEKPGDVVNENGKVIGRHNGAPFFTIGERHGFVITEKTNNDSRYYVVGKDLSQNKLIVSDHLNKEETKKTVELSDTNISPLTSGVFECSYRERYRAPLKICKVEINENKKITVQLDKPNALITPGQSFVLYNGEICLGGGIIK